MMDDSCKVLVPSYIVGIGSRVVVVGGAQVETGQSGTQLLQRRLGNK